MCGCTQIKKKQSTQDVEFWSNQEDNNTKVVLPLDVTDTYQLMENSDIVVTYGSTVGIEAVYNYKPVIALGRCVYEFSEEIMKPRNTEELHAFLSTPTIPKSRIGAEKYGYYRMMKKCTSFLLQTRR